MSPKASREMRDDLVFGIVLSGRDVPVAGIEGAARACLD